LYKFVNNIRVALGRCQKRKTKRHLSCKALRRYFRVGTRRMTLPTPFSLRWYFREGTRRVTLPTPLPCINRGAWCLVSKVEY